MFYDHIAAHVALARVKVVKAPSCTRGREHLVSLRPPYQHTQRKRRQNPQGLLAERGDRVMLMG